MATKPTPGGSDGTYGTELNAFLDESLASDGKIKTEALQTDATAPSADAALANKKYVDDTGFQDRGDPATADFAVGDLVTDNTWNDLDLSSIVTDSNAKAVLLFIDVKDDVADSAIRFRKNGNSNEVAVSVARTQIVDQTLQFNLTVSMDASQVIEYNGDNLTFSTINITVLGWWL